MESKNVEAEACDLAKSKNLVLQEFLQSRTDSKQLDGFLIDMDSNKVHLVKGIQKFLVDNQLQSNVNGKYDPNTAERYILNLRNNNIEVLKY
jgi:hypothetical protein